MPRPPLPRARARPGFRPDIQALRAIAVAAVVIDHVWPGALPGGYTGVDVFFVVSGFLITSHLLRDAEATGRVRLLTFYGRRIRRLLPSALLVLALAGLAVWAWLPPSLWRRTAAELVGSAGYVENWVLTAIGANYSASSEAPTVVQHYWSLSVEEQFYLVWPAFIIAAGAIAVRLGTTRRAAALVTIGSLGVASLVASAITSPTIPSAAYFATYNRIWEFALGAALAIVAPRLIRTMPRALATVLQAVGFAGIAASTFLIPAGIPYPGLIALAPTLATALVIAVGTIDPARAAPRILDWWPIQRLGDISYALYLWHWPIVVITPFLLRAGPGPLERGLEVIGAVVLAALSYRLVERPVQRWSWLAARPLWTLLGMVGAMAVVALVAGSMVIGYYRSPAMQGSVPIAAPVTAPCTGPLALLDRCGPAAVNAAVAESEMGPRNSYGTTPPHCAPDPAIPLGTGGDLALRCDFRITDGDPTVWLLGDSHAQQWQWALWDLAQVHHWDLVIAVRGSCPPADVLRTPGGPEQLDCRDWMRSAAATITAAKPTAVYTAGFTTHEPIVVGPGEDPLAVWRSGLEGFWDKWTSEGVQVNAIGDPPINANFEGQVDIPGLERGAYCIIFHFADPGACTEPRSLVVGTDPLLTAAQQLSRANPMIHPIDVTRFFCDERICYAAIGGISVYADWNHLNPDYSRRLSGYIDNVDAPVGR